jgi:predicted ABC-type ATPase
MSAKPSVIVLAGPNGAGKSTLAPVLLRGKLGVTEFVNADVIARGLSAFDPDRVALQAGRIMLERLRELAERRETFAFETTLASRSFAPWIALLIESGYRFHLAFVWLPDVEMALQRVRDRVRSGGHNVPEETIRRRYTAGLRNFLELYQPLADSWRLYDNSDQKGPKLVALGRRTRVRRVVDAEAWNTITAASEEQGA